MDFYKNLIQWMGPPGMSLSVTFQKKKKKMNEEYNFCDISYWQRESNVLLNKNNSVYYIWNIHMKKKKMTSKCSQMDVKNFSFYYYM